MAKLVVGTKILQLLEASVQHGHSLRKTATPVGPGLWELDIDEEVADHIETHRLPDESNDAAIERLIMLATHGLH